jgi:hypothetical protein
MGLVDGFEVESGFEIGFLKELGRRVETWLVYKRRAGKERTTSGSSRLDDV